MHEYATFLLHSFIATPIVTLLTKTFFSSLCSFLHPIANHVLFVHRALPLLADALDEIDASQITAELTSDSAVQQVTARLLRALTVALPALSARPIAQFTAQSTTQPTTQPTTQLTTQPTTQSTTQPTTQSTAQATEAEAVTDETLTLKEALLSMHVLNTLGAPSDELLSAAEQALRRWVAAFKAEASKPSVVRQKPGRELQMLIAEIVRYLLVHSSAYDAMEALMQEVLAVFHFYPLILSSLAESYHHLPDACRTEAKLVALMTQYACYLNSPRHTERQSWLRLFLAFQQCDVGSPVFDDV